MKSFLLSVLFILLLLCSIYDIKKGIIPNIPIAIILVFGIVNSILYHNTPYNAIAGIVVPALPLFLIKSRFDFLGAGDIKLLSALGVWLGWLLNIFIFIFACVTALIFVLLYRFFSEKQIKSIPFAPFLSLATLSVYLLSLLRLS